MVVNGVMKNGKLTLPVYCTSITERISIPYIRQGKMPEKDDEAAVSAYIQEKALKNGQVLWPLRTAVTGKQMTPGGAYEIMPILGKDECLRRIRIGVDKLCH
jgi:glutamyl/glutaminyl-tRNA synthetase